VTTVEMLFISIARPLIYFKVEVNCIFKCSLGHMFL